MSNISNLPLNDLDCSREDLIKLLIHLESLLARKDEEIVKIKEEKSRGMLNQAKYGMLMTVDPLRALERDGALSGEKLDQSVLSVYEYQQRELERLCQLYKSNYLHYREILSNIEKKHRSIVEELENENYRSGVQNAHAGNIISKLEESRDKLAKQLDEKAEELTNLQESFQIEKDRREREKNDHKLMIKYLLTERKDLFITIQKMKLELTSKGDGAPVSGDSPLVREMRKEIDLLRSERHKLNDAVHSLQKRNSELSQKLKIKEEDVLTMRQNIMSKTKQEQMMRSNAAGGLVVANKGAIARHQAAPFRNGIPTSVSFPSTTPGTSYNNPAQKQQPSTSTYKKFPTIPVPGSNVPLRNQRVPYLGTKAPVLSAAKSFGQPIPATDNEIDKLGLVVMEPINIMTKRSFSLPRNAQSKIESIPVPIKLPPSGIPTNGQRRATACVLQQQPIHIYIELFKTDSEIGELQQVAEVCSLKNI
uniref:Cortactin-binding protein-2 N-terminal domain-containing protein n=1 Tax=Panagrolaimus sp. JU765 TaxID=591449 RepID=A0AC34PUC2_9BILA